MKKNFNKGFTLIELLLAVAIFSIVSLCVYNTFSSGILLSRRAQQEDTLSREIRWTFDLLSRELENMVPYDFINSYPDQFSFEGENEKLLFITADTQGLKFVTYSLVPPDEGTVKKTVIGKTYKKNVAIKNIKQSKEPVNYLVRREYAFIDYLTKSNDQKAQIEVIATHIKEGGLKISYGVQSQDAKRLSWKSEWKGKDFPAYVRLEINFVDADQNFRTLVVTKDVFIPLGTAKEEKPAT